MDDLISRQAAIDCVKASPINGWVKEDLIQALETTPSAQPEIVRCKDCKWKQGAECVRFAEIRPFPDDFCSRGERKTDG